MNTDNNKDGYDSDNDSDFEAELNAITNVSVNVRSKPKEKPSFPSIDLDQLVSESLKDVDDNDSDFDENDPELLNELSNITQSDDTIENIIDKSEVDIPKTSDNITDMLKTRIQMYKLAEQNAKLINDSSKTRRFNRGLKTLENLLKQVQNGKTINMDDIPPEVTTKLDKPTGGNNVQSLSSVSIRPASPLPTEIAKLSTGPAIEKYETSATVNVSIDQSKINILLARQREYKIAAITAKKAGNIDAALSFVKIYKIFDTVLAAAQNGEPVDLSDMPPFPNMDVLVAPTIIVPEATTVESAEVQTKPESVSEQIIISATNILDALTQRLKKYESVEESAKEEHNQSKARRFIIFISTLKY